MRKLNVLIVALFLSFNCFSKTTLVALNKNQIEKNIVNNTLVSIPIGNLNDKTIQDVFYIYIDKSGNIFGKMSNKIGSEPQLDQGTYSLKRDGTIHYT